MKAIRFVTVLFILCSCVGAVEEGFQQFEYAGYTDTPMIPGTDFRVHQPDRPQPPRVIPDQRIAALKIPAPSDATVLFDGTSLDHFTKTEWQIQDGVLIVGKGGLTTQKPYGDFQLHIEWRAPNPPAGKPSNMGNSGLYIMGRYELQIYDSYSSKIYADGSAAAIYGQTPPLVNACVRPGQWQSYDVIFTAPVFQDGKLVSAAYITVLHNGILVHNHTKILGPTGHRVAKPYEAHAPKLPLFIQGHNSPVAFRNIWIRE